MLARFLREIACRKSRNGNDVESSNMKQQAKSLLGIVAVSLTGVLSASASSLSYNFGAVSDGSAPAGSPPWIQAVLSDTGLPANTINLTLTAGNLTGSDFVSCWYFNLNPSLDPTHLSFTVSDSTGSFTGPSVQTGVNGFKAGPDGKFDVLVGFASGGDDSTRFTSGDSVSFNITGISGLTVEDFGWLSTSASGGGAFVSAAHVVSGDDSGWINPVSTFSQNATTAPSVPDGATTIALLGASLLAIEALRRMQLRFATVKK